MHPWTLSPFHLFNSFVSLWYETTTILMLTLQNVMEKFATLSISLLLLQLMIQARDNINMDWRNGRRDPNPLIMPPGEWRFMGMVLQDGSYYLWWFTGFLINIFRRCGYLNADSCILNVLSLVEWVFVCNKAVYCVAVWLVVFSKVLCRKNDNLSTMR